MVMIYKFKSHSLYYEEGGYFDSSFSLAIDTLELVCDLTNGKLLGIQGFFPLVKAIHCDIELPVWKNGDYSIHNIDLLHYKQNEIYDLTKRIPEIAQYFEPLSIRYDPKKGIIQIGEVPSNKNMGVKVNRNIICGYDDNLNLQSIFLIPDEFI